MPVLRFRGLSCRVPDLDQLFCYETTKLVNVLDWKPGVVYRAGIIFTCLYCFGFALIVNQMYLSHHQAFGSVMVTATGDAYSQPMISTEPDTEESPGATSRRLLQIPTLAPTTRSPYTTDAGRHLLATKAPSHAPTPADTTPQLPAYRYWDAHDTVTPDSESGGITLATRVLSTKSQTMKPCPNKDLACPAECKTELPIFPGTCYPHTEFCMEYNWCPLFGQGGDKSTEELITGVDEFELDFMVTMNFEGPDDPSAVAVKHHKMTVAELLKEVDVTYADVQSTGIIIYAKLQWGTASDPCSMSADCEVTLEAVRMDKEPVGFYYRQSNYYRGNGTLPKEYRDVSRTYAIRVIASSSGYGVAFSFVDAMLQVASAFAMFALSYVIADFFVVWLNFRREKYIEFKIEETPDISDLKEKQAAAKIDAQTNKKSRRPRVNRARQPKPETESDED